MCIRDRESGYECQFIEKPPKQFQSECPVCLLVLREPYQATCCGYSFCRVCIDQVKANCNPCPCCKKPHFQDFPNKGLQRSLNVFKVQCVNQNQGCQWVGELGELDSHLNSDSFTLERQLSGCKYVVIKCLYCSKLLQRSDIQIHLNDHCHRRPFSCKYCGEFESYYEDVTTNHWPICGYYLVPCPNECGETLQRQNLENHIANDCPLTVVDCDFKHVGCEVKLLHKDLSAHLVENIVTHVSLQAASYKQLVMKFEKENKELKLKNEQLNQRVKEQERQLTKLSKDLLAFQISTPLLPIEFTMTNFEQHFNDDSSWSSQPFYTHTRGYKMFLDIDAYGYGEGGGTHVSVYVNIMQGEFDDTLLWPFRGDITIQMLNQEGGEEHYTKILHYTNSTPDKYAKRATEEEEVNDGWGYHKFYPHNDLRPKYLKNECLKLRIEQVVVKSGLS